MTDQGDDGAETDLFGNPILPMRDLRGRPSYRKTKENQQLVADLRGGGMTQAEIATVLGCDEKTLRKHFSRELEAGSALAKGTAIRVIMDAMRKGSVAAARRVLEIADARPVAPRKAAAKPLGKKEAAQEAARNVPGEWGDLIPDGPVN